MVTIHKSTAKNQKEEQKEASPQMNWKIFLDTFLKNFLIEIDKSPSNAET